MPYGCREFVSSGGIKLLHWMHTHMGKDRGDIFIKYSNPLIYLDAKAKLFSINLKSRWLWKLLKLLSTNRILKIREKVNSYFEKKTEMKISSTLLSNYEQLWLNIWAIAKLLLFFHLNNYYSDLLHDTENCKYVNCLHSTGIWHHCHNIWLHVI